MKHQSEVLSVDPEFLTLRRCTNPRTCGEPTEGNQICGWRIFDEVVILADVSSQAPQNAGEALKFKGLACRSCGALQPDGIPPELIAKMNPVEICENHQIED